MVKKGYQVGSKSKGGSQVEIKADPVRYAPSGVSKVSFKGTDHVTSYGSQDEYGSNGVS